MSLSSQVGRWGHMSARPAFSARPLWLLSLQKASYHSHPRSLALLVERLKQKHPWFEAAASCFL